MVADKYALALFEIAMRKNTLDEYVEQFDRFYSLIKEQPKWIEVMGSPVVKADQKREMIFSLPSFNKDFLQFIYVVVINKHILDIELIYNEWLSVSSKEQKVAYINVYIAKKPTEERISLLKEELQPYFPDLELKFDIVIDKSLIKGVRIVYQGMSIDHSIKTQLKKLQSSI